MDRTYKKYIKDYTHYLLKALKIKRALNIVLTDNKEILRLHKYYFADNTPTDVISFHSYDIKGFLGEVVISVEYAKRESKKRNIKLEEELARYITHGVLHLLGYRDDSPKHRKVMWRKQEKLLKDYCSNYE